METATPPTHYDTLGVPPDADAEVIKKAYRSLARSLHPDLNPSPEAAERFKQVGEAYAVVSDEELRREYDEELAAPPEEPLPDPADFEDDWGAEATWSDPDLEATPDESSPADDAVLDDAVILDDPPTFDPPPSPGTQEPTSTAEWAGPAVGSQQSAPVARWKQGPFSDPQFIYPAQAGQRVTLAGLVVIVALSVLTLIAHQEPASAGLAKMRLPIILGSIILGAIVGGVMQANASDSTKSKPKRSPRKRPAHQPRQTAPINPWGALGVASCIAVAVAILSPTSIKLAACGLALLMVSGVVTATWLRFRREQRDLDKVLPLDTLRTHSLYGALPGGVAADLLDKDCAALFAIPSVRAMRSPKEGGFFSHALVSGNRVALVRAIVASPGHYRWSGPSLLRESASGYPEEVMKGAYAEHLQQVLKQAGPKVEINSWLLLYTNPPGAPVFSTGNALCPQVAEAGEGLDRIGEFLAQSEPVVNQKRVAESFAIL